MAKVIQRNWLLIITGLLVISLLVVLLITVDEKTDLGRCSFGGIDYRKGDFVQNYKANTQCYCLGSNKIKCDDQNDFSISYSTFSTESLLFSYTYQNYLEKEEPDYTRVLPVDLNQTSEYLEIILEREALCGDNDLAPSQVGFYEFRGNSLILTTMTNRDVKLYDRTCLIANVFKIYSKVPEIQEGFSVLYQNELGQLFDLNVCYYGEKLFSTGDSFKHLTQNKICSCEQGSVICK